MLRRDNYGLMSHFELYLSGTKARPEITKDMLDCTVENSIHLPDVCTFRLYDTKFQWLDATEFKEGTEVEIKAGSEEDTTPATLFHGEITALEMDMAALGTPTVLVRCYDRSHRLHRGRYSRTFVNVTDSDIVQQVGSEMGFTVTSDPTSIVHDWVMQDNESNWEFLNDRAARNGHRLYVKGLKELCFKGVDAAPGDTVTLTWGDNLRSFRPRVNTHSQVDQVVVRGWDHKTKQALVGTSDTGHGLPATGQSETGAARATSAFGAAKMMVTDRPVFTQSEADTLAKSIYDDMSGEYLEAEGMCYGTPTLVPGKTVTLANISTRFNGTYFVTSTTHIYSAKEGYTTLFAINGKKPATVLAAMEWDGGGSRQSQGGNILVGIVTDNNDPTNLGRVKVKYPALTDEHTSDWARTVNAMGGSGRGFSLLPEVNDEVLVAFEHGDIHRPYVLGGLWNGTDASPLTSAQAVEGTQVVRRVLKTRLGHQIRFKDTADKGGIAVITASNHRVEFHDDTNQILIKTNLGHFILLDDDNQKIVVQDKTTTNKMTIDSAENSIAIECMGNFSVKATGSVSIQGEEGITLTTPAQLSATADGGVEVSTLAAMSLQAEAEMTLEATGVASLTGSMVMINS